MPTEETQTQFRDVEDALKKADSAFQQQRFSEAVPLYDRCLTLLRQLRPADHSDVTYCLQNLADSYALSRSFERALELLGELKAIREKQPGNQADLVGVLFKIARMQEMLGDNGGARRSYEEALAAGEEHLYSGHPFLGAILSGYANLLDAEDAELELRRNVQQKMKANQNDTRAVKLGDAVLQNMHLKEFRSLVPNRPDKKEEAAQLEQMRKNEERAKKLKSLLPKIAIGVALLGAVVVGSGVYLKHSSIEKAQSDREKVSKNFDGKSYQSADGDRLSFEKTQVDAIIRGIHRKLPFEVEPKTTDFSAKNSQVVSFRRVPNGLLADEGKLYYSPDSRDFLVLKRMKTIADAAQKYYNNHDNQYPQSLEQLVAEDPKVRDNLLTGKQDDFIVINAGRLRDWRPDAEPPPVYETLQTKALLPGEPPLEPGVVHCYHFSCGDPYIGMKCAAFFIRVCDDDGNFISDGPNKVYCANLIAGQMPSIFEGSQGREPSPQDIPVTKIRLIDSE